MTDHPIIAPDCPRPDVTEVIALSNNDGTPTRIILTDETGTQMEIPTGRMRRLLAQALAGPVIDAATKALEHLESAKDEIFAHDPDPTLISDDAESAYEALDQPVRDYHYND